MKKIAFITPEIAPFQRGGCGVSAELYVRILRSYGIEVDLFVFDEKRQAATSKLGKTEYFECSMQTKLEADFKIAGHLFHKLAGYDLVHVIGIRPMLGTKILQLLDNHRPLISTLNSFEWACFNFQNYVEGCRQCTELKLFKCIAERKKSFLKAPGAHGLFRARQYLSRKVDYFFVLSEPLRQMYINAGFDESKLKIVPNMIDPLFLKEKQASNVQSELRGNKVKFVFVGRLSPEKAVQDLLMAFAKLKENSNATLEIVGSGPEEDRLKHMALDLDIASKTVFRGQVQYSDIHHIYKDADVFVHSGIWPEPFGRTIIEAMSYGLPVICSDVGAPPQIIGDGGLTYKPGDPGDLSQKMAALLADEKKRMRLGDLALKKVSQYTVEANIGRIFDIYERAIRRHIL